MKKIISLALSVAMLAMCIVPASASSAPNPPSVGAYESGTYRNLFAEIGKSQTDVDEKVDAAFNQLFHGNDNQTLYYTNGSDMAHIRDIANGDVRSEGMSYAMMICVQLDKKEEFDKLWKFARTKMYQTSGGLKAFLLGRRITMEA